MPSLSSMIRRARAAAASRFVPSGSPTPLCLSTRRARLRWTRWLPPTPIRARTCFRSCRFRCATRTFLGAAARAAGRVRPQHVLSDFSRLELNTNPFLEKQLQLLIESIEDLQQESNACSTTSAPSSAKVCAGSLLSKRQAENAARKARGGSRCRRRISAITRSSSLFRSRHASTRCSSQTRCPPTASRSTSSQGRALQSSS